MQLVRPGAYVVDDFGGTKIDFHTWQYWQQDPEMRIELGGGSLRIFGVTSVNRRAFSGLVSRKLYPPDAILIVEMCMPCRYDQEGTFGFVTHLCNRLLGDEIQARTIPDNNSEITFGRLDETKTLGWFNWWFDHVTGRFYKWIKDAPLLLPFGDEATSFQTVRVAYSAPQRALSAAILREGKWHQVGETQNFLKLFSSIELKIDSYVSGLELEARYRNCRLFPQPSRFPVRVFVGDPKPIEEARVQLWDFLGQNLVVEASVDSDGLAALTLPSEAVFPMSGWFRVQHKGKQLDELRVQAKGIVGIYPDDFYGAAGEQ